MNTIDWLRESAQFLVWDRPDVYDHETAVEELSVAMDSLREAENQTFSCIMFTSYALMRIFFADEDNPSRGVEEFVLSRKLSSVIVFEAENQVSAYAYHDDIDLPSPLDDLPDL